MNVTPLRQSARRIGNWERLPFFNNGQFTAVCWRLRAETRPVLPAAGNILRAFKLTRPEDVRVVIVGQDPYPHWNPRLAAGLATGLAFAVPDCTVVLPSSLSNILGKIPNFQTGQNLEHWAEQGVLLLNAILTIPVDVVKGTQKGKIAGHKSFGWSDLIKDVTTGLTDRRSAFFKKDVVFMFFGSVVRDMDIIPPNLPNRRKIRAGHPSHPGTKPQSPGWVTFKAAKPFAQVNSFFRQLSPQKPPIAW